VQKSSDSNYDYLQEGQRPYTLYEVKISPKKQKKKKKKNQKPNPRLAQKKPPRVYKQTAETPPPPPPPPSQRKGFCVGGCGGLGFWRAFWVGVLVWGFCVVAVGGGGCWVVILFGFFTTTTPPPKQNSQPTPPPHPPFFLKKRYFRQRPEGGTKGGYSCLQKTRQKHGRAGVGPCVLPKGSTRGGELRNGLRHQKREEAGSGERNAHSLKTPGRLRRGHKSRKKQTFNRIYESLQRRTRLPAIKKVSPEIDDAF